MSPQAYLKGAPVSLAVLDYGLFRVHANGRVIGICGYVIRTDAGECVLVDTGFPPKYAQDTEAATQADCLYEFGEVLACTPDHLPAAQLARLGLTGADITLHVLTHTHIDHVGGLETYADDYPDAPILMARTERDLPKPLYWGDVQPLDWPDVPYLLVDGDVQVGPGFRILLVPGHAPGQLALLLDLPETGPVLLTSDAISRPAEIEERFAGSWDEAQAQASGARLMALAQEQGAFVIYGHCPQQWAELRKAPEIYT